MNSWDEARDVSTLSYLPLFGSQGQAPAGIQLRIHWPTSDHPYKSRDSRY
ncbi:MAG: hypothetical protein AAF471_04975 [Myxococcota bacterium]